MYLHISHIFLQFLPRLFFYLLWLWPQEPGADSQHLKPVTVINESVPIACLCFSSVGSNSGRHGLSFLIPCLHFPNSVGPKDFGVLEALSCPTGCRGEGLANHISLICSEKVARCPGNNVNAGSVFWSRLRCAGSGKYTSDFECLVRQQHQKNVKFLISLLKMGYKWSDNILDILG